MQKEEKKRSLLQVFSIGFSLCFFKVRSREKVASTFCTSLGIGKFGFFIINCNGLGAMGSSSCFRHEHDLAVLFQHDEPGHCRFNSCTSRQDAVILKNESYGEKF